MTSRPHRRATASSQSECRHLSVGLRRSRRHQGVQIKCHVKEEMFSSPHICHTPVNGSASQPRRAWRDKVYKEEVSSAIVKARGRLIHYLSGRSGGGSLSTRATVSIEDRAAQHDAPLCIRQVGRGAGVGPWGPQPGGASARNRPVTTVEMAAWHRCRLNGELDKIDKEWLLSDTFDAVGRGNADASAPRPGSALATAALRTPVPFRR